MLTTTDADPNVIVSYPANKTSSPRTSGPWTVEVNGSPETIVDVTVPTNTDLNLELANSVSTGDEVRVVYDPPPYEVKRASDGAKAAAQDETVTVP